MQELQKQLDELTADHEATVEAMRTAHCEEIESLRRALSSQLDPGAIEIYSSAAATDEPANSVQSNSISSKAVDPTHGFCNDCSLCVRSLRDLAALYHKECKHTACLQSKLNAFIEFIKYIDNLDQSSDAVEGRLPDDFCKDESDITIENSRENVLAAVHTFALSFRQAVSDFPLQVENLQRIDKFISRRMQLSIVQSNDGARNLLTATEISAENKQPSSDHPEISSLSVTVGYDDRPTNGKESVISVNVESSADDRCSPVDSRVCYSETGLVNEHTYGGREQKEEVAEEAVVAAEFTGELDASHEEHVTPSSSDVHDGRLQEQFITLKRKSESQSAKLRDTVTELSQYKEKNESQASEISRLSKDNEHLRAINAEITNQATEKSSFEKQCSVLQLELDKMTERTSQLQEEASCLQKDKDLAQEYVDSLQKKVQDHAAELAQVKEVYETKIVQLSSKIDELQNKLETDRKLRDAEAIKVTDLHTAEIETNDTEIANLTRTIDGLKEMLMSQHDEFSSAVSSKDEIICSVEEKHRFEVAAMTERFKKKISELEHGHHRSLEEYRKRIAEMEQSDIELNTQLIAVTEKFNSVTEYTASAERVIEDCRSKADKWAAEREEIVKAAETASAELSGKEAEIVALKEEIQMLKQPSDVHDVPVLNAKNVELEMDDLMSRDNSEPRLGRLNIETCGLDTSSRENDKLVKLQQENFHLTQQLSQQQSENTASLKEQQEKVVEQMRLEHRAAVQDVEDQHNSKVLHLIKDFNAQMAAHEKDLRESVNSDLGWLNTALF